MIEHLVADVLDQQLVDEHGTNAGRVDGIVLRCSADAAPVVTHIEVGPITLLARFSRRLARWYARADRRLGPERGKSFRIELGRLRVERLAIRFDTALEATPIDALEDHLREQVIDRVLGRPSSRAR